MSTSIRSVLLTSSVGPAVGLDGMQYSWGGCWVDADGDMWSDLMVATYRFPNSLPYDNYYYSNELQGTLFEDQTEAVWPNEQTQLYCVAACDINQDLAPDVVGFGNMPYAQILQNNGVGGGADAGRLTVELCGTSSNRLAIGAEVNVYAGGVTQMQLVSCGSDYMTQQSWKRFFGLADAGIVDSVVVEWPGGASEAWYDIPVNTELRLVEGTSDAAVSVLGSSCAGDSAWLVFPFEAPVRTLNGVEVCPRLGVFGVRWHIRGSMPMAEWIVPVDRYVGMDPAAGPRHHGGMDSARLCR